MLRWTLGWRAAAQHQLVAAVVTLFLALLGVGWSLRHLLHFYYRRTAKSGELAVRGNFGLGRGGVAGPWQRSPSAFALLSGSGGCKPVEGIARSATPAAGVSLGDARGGPRGATSAGEAGAGERRRRRR